MPNHIDHYRNILQFWRSAEIFALPDLPVKKRNDNRKFTELAPDKRFPWEAGQLPVASEGKKWKHTLYFNIVPKEAVVELLARLTKSTEFRDPIYGDTCMSALVLNHLGQPEERSYCPAAFVYGIRILREKLDPEELTALLKKAHEDYLVRFQIEKKQGEKEEEELPEINMVDWRVLKKELTLLRELVQNKLNAQTGVVCISEQVAATTNPEAPFLNSYFVNDLNTLINSPESIGRPMEIFLAEEVAFDERVNLLQQQTLLERLNPKNQSAGRWPAHPAHGLYTGQQVALNIALPGLRHSSGLLGINGPPGTGKTTLLREVIADVVVSRAKRLLKADVRRLFAGKRNTIIDKLGYYTMDATVLGNDGIVVSSNNNNAIENISRAVPVLESIDRETFADAEYFSLTATAIHDRPCWGMLSAVLGKSDNRTAFVDRFWFKGGSFRIYLKEQYEDIAAQDRYAENYASTAGELTELLGVYEGFQSLAAEYHETLGQVLLRQKESQRSQLQALARRLEEEWGILSTNLPDADFFNWTEEEVQRLMPYSSERINILRSEIFLRSLELQEWAIRVNARQFSSNLNAFINMISNKQPGSFNEEIAAMLWGSLFFCIPVVSVTLASFQRQFSKMGQGSIGWLLLDEAGQATLPSVCGAIWRSQRCIIIGDTLQIQPVVTLPIELGKLLQQVYKIRDDCWSPIGHSAQSLADRITDTGTYIYMDNETVTWTGIPLRAHRRCSEPMFSISNTIAYSGQMVKVTADAPVDILTGDSGWIDVQIGTIQEGHAIVEELLVLDELLQQLTLFDGKIFVISPFRSISEICKAEYAEPGRVECGTIHTFQGKEADIVFLVLGTPAGNDDARNWVASSPNMLNVAITRAQKRLYVIGNRKIWSRHEYFDYLARVLPVKEHFSGRLF